MNERKVPFLCGGVFFFLLTQATLPNGSARDHRDGNKDEHSEPVLMTDLIYTFTGCQDYGSKKDTSKYKDCLSEGSCNLPFNDIAVCTTYENAVTGKYHVALSRMDEFVRWHINPEMKEWLVKALLEILENDNDIKENDELYIDPDGIAVSKALIRDKCDFDFSGFLVGVLHFILAKRREKNCLGEPTLDSIGIKKNRKPRQYTGSLGEAITRKIEVEFLPGRETLAPEAVGVVSDDPTLATVVDETDDDVINGALHRTGEVLLSAFGGIEVPKPDTKAMADSLAVVAAATQACAPDEKQKENMVHGISTIASAFEAQKHAMADEIRKNSRRESSASSYAMPDREEEQAEETAQEDKKTTIIQQQTNVIQNGDNNVNVTNNGTMNFNF